MYKNKIKKVFRSANLRKFFTKELASTSNSYGVVSVQYVKMSNETIKNFFFIKKKLLQDVPQDQQIQVVLLILSYVNNKNISNEIIIDPKYLQVLLTLLTTGSAEMPLIINLIDPILNSNVDQQNNLADNLIKLSKYVPTTISLVQKISDINKTNISKMNILSKQTQDILLIKLNEMYKSSALSNIKIDINKYTSLLPILYFLPFVQFINDDSMKKTIVSNIIKKLLNISNESQYIDEQPNNIDKEPTNNANTNEIFKIILNEVKTSLGENQFKMFIQSTNNLEKSSGYLEGERIRIANNLEKYKNRLGTLTLDKFNDNVENIGIYMENTIHQQVLNIMKIINPNPTPPAPVITLNGDDNVKVKNGEKYEELRATAIDNQGKNLDVKIIGDVDTSKKGSYTVTYSATDGVGNTSTVKRTVIVFVPPTITLNGDDNVKVKIGGKYEELGATAIDNQGKKLDVKITGDVVTSKKDSYTVTYSATDSEGYTSTITRTVIVFVPPPPVITLTGGSRVVINLGVNYNDLGASAKDYENNDLTVTNDANKVDINKEGEYLVTYTAKDDVGNTSTVTRTVIVFVPPPVITLKGDNPYKVKIGGTYEELGATAIDNQGNKVECKITGDVVTSKNGSYTVTYSATDIEGYTSTITRTVIVFVPPPPVITLSGLNPLVFNWTTKLIFEIAIADLRASAKDYNGNDISVESDAENKREYVFKNGVGEYLVTYSATDDVGNTSTATRRIQVINFSLYGDSFVDQSNTTGGYGGGNKTQWQSFTPSKDGLLEKIEWLIGSPLAPNSAASIVMRLYEGEGTSGAKLAESSGLNSPGGNDSAWAALDNINIYVTTKRYTIEISTSVNIDTGWIFYSKNNYDGGRADRNGITYMFKTHMRKKKDFS